MARGINQVNVMGRLTRDPEMRTTSTGKMIASFSVAVDRQSGEETDFFDVTCWNQLAEIVEKYTQKGSKVYVSGRLQLDRWESDGQKKQKVSIIANDVTFLDSAASRDAAPQGDSKPVTDWDIAHPEGPKSKTDDEKPIDLSEIPF